MEPWSLRGHCPLARPLAEITPCRALDKALRNRSQVMSVIFKNFSLTPEFSSAVPKNFQCRAKNFQPDQKKKTRRKKTIHYIFFQSHFFFFCSCWLVGPRCLSFFPSSSSSHFSENYGAIFLPILGRIIFWKTDERRTVWTQKVGIEMGGGGVTDPEDAGSNPPVS